MGSGFQVSYNELFRAYSHRVRKLLKLADIPLILHRSDVVSPTPGRRLTHHHHQVVPLARIFQTLSRHFSLSFIAFGRSSGLHPVSSHSCWMYIRAGRPAFARQYVGVHRWCTHKWCTHLCARPASLAVSCMSGSSSMDSFRDRRQVAA